MAIGAIIFYSTLQNNRIEEDTIFSSNHISKPKSASIPENYSQDLDLDGVYVYNVTDFGGTTSWHNFSSEEPLYGYEGDWAAEIGGQIKINITGFYNEDPLYWGDIFYDSIPWMDIEIIKNDSGVPVSNFTLTNRSNTEISYNLILGYSSFQPGFLIPIDNLTNIKKIAIEEVDKAYFSGQSIVEESYHFLYIGYENVGGMKTNMLYDKSTGLLVWAKTSLGGYQMEISSLNFTYNLDLTYNYTVKAFGEPFKWFNMSGDFKGNVNTTINGLVRVNFTGYHDKDVNDNSIFENPIPWIDIAFIENNTGILNTNFTLNDISNSEAALNLHIGFNNFSSGFLIPTNNLTSLKENATLEGSGDQSNYLLFSIEETGLTVKFIFIETGGENYSITTYDKRTGLLMAMRAVSGNFLLDMELVLYYEESNPIPPPNPYTKTIYNIDVEEKKGEKEYSNFTIPFILLGCGAAASFGLLVWKKETKMLKYLFTGIFGAICFSSLLVFNYWLNSGAASTDEKSNETALEVVEDITLIVDFGDGNIKSWKGFTLSGGKTTVLDALDKYCDIKYDDYGWGILVTEIDGVDGKWIYEVNGEKPGHGADRHYLRDGDTIRWEFQGK